MSGTEAGQVDEAHRWLCGPIGQTVARQALAKSGLPSDASAVDDLNQQVLVNIWHRLRSGPLDGSVEAYARTCLAHATIDLLRRGEPARLADLLDVHGNEPSVGPQHDDGTDHEVAAAELLAQMRHALHTLGAERRRLRPWTISAALVTLELAVCPDLELLAGTPCPNPRSRAAGDGARWAALAYAGRSDCFVEPETGAVRERRSTALARVRDTLADARAAAEGSP